MDPPMLYTVRQRNKQNFCTRNLDNKNLNSQVDILNKIVQNGKSASKNSLNSGDVGSVHKKDDRLFLKVTARKLQPKQNDTENANSQQLRQSPEDIRSRNKNSQAKSSKNFTVCGMPPPNPSSVSIVRLPKRNQNLSMLPPLNDWRRANEFEQIHTSSSNSLGIKIATKSTSRSKLPQL